MKKKNFVLLLGETASVLIFALGMCMCLLTEWNMFQTGVIVATSGIGCMLIVFALYCKCSGTSFKVNGRVAGITILVAAGSLIFGTGMCMTMVWSQYMVYGIVVGIIGILMLLCLIPAVKGWS